LPICVGSSPAPGDLSPKDELRIYGKRSRYAADLLHEKGDIGAFLEALAGLQEVLGDHQDACVLEDRLRELVDEVADPHAGIAAGRVIQGCRERRVAARAAYPDAWKKAEATARKAFPADTRWAGARVRQNRGPLPAGGALITARFAGRPSNRREPGWSQRSGWGTTFSSRSGMSAKSRGLHV
jgi:hypothetical protein